MRRPFLLALTLLSLQTATTGAAPADPAWVELDGQFTNAVLPFIGNYCIPCHSQKNLKGDLDLDPFTSAGAVVKDSKTWELVLERLKEGDMPPKKAKDHPSPEARRDVIAWIQGVRRFEAHRNAGDPGPVLARRLSNAEYDYTIRDLTGVDIRPTKEFPVDPANTSGFDNTGESLAMSPALVKKYLEAARLVSNHLVLKPDGFDFAPHLMLADTDRDKYCVKRIISFYGRQRIDYADFFQAAWRYQHRAALGKPQAALADFAAAGGISPKYLAAVWSVLTDAKEETGPVAALQTMWRELPAPGGNGEADARAGCEKMRDFVAKLREALKPPVAGLVVRGEHAGSQPLVLWKNRQYAANRMAYAGNSSNIRVEDFARGAAAAALTAPADDAGREKYEAGFKRFCAVFPDAFFISERARDYLTSEKEREEEKKNKGRYLSAGFHSQMGYFRDDGPLYDLVLDDNGRRELDDLWKELDFIAATPQRQYSGFLWFERTDSRFMLTPEFDFAKAEDKDAASEAKIKKLAEVYVAKVRQGTTSAVAINAVQEHFDRVNASIRWVEQARLAAEPSHLAALQAFAERAYRRPLTQREKDGVVAFYRTLRSEDGLGHEDAVRDTVVSILMSPYFCYRADPRPAQGGVTPLSDIALASRLSYFLWSSMPDKELLAHAAAGDLHRPDVLVAQARRMLRDDKVRGLATEFGGNWLDFRRFEEHNAVDRERFPAFTNELRQAMYEEPIRFLLDLVRTGRPVSDFLYAKHTFVNPVLAKHYGMPVPPGGPDEWVRVDDADKYARGGLLPMAVFLTKNAPGLRTSPVKRGNWVIRSLLGERVPPPPPDVPQLPTDESKLGQLTLRETLAMHREDKGCATCHLRFDSIGLTFEGYGPVGEWRDKDLGGRPVDTRATFPGGSEGAGFDGLKSYLRGHRQDDFLDNLCRKLLAYGLGRGLILSDDLMVEEMRAKLAANGYRFDSLVETIVTSPQFLNQRGRDELAKE